ncbi:hypothetical protein [Bartonella grahamii]|uniref:Uncharacterized protein n=1 Tax=Bartonella grahamii TaxID=33045 RepID=A0A336NBG0_BARGR|nr:hypothetical protein [Bartonella grahamii]SSZ39626.1 Uncharacterised protein [Bartonella grahamii]
MTLWRCFSKRAFAVAAFTYQMGVKSITYLSVGVISETGIQPANLGGKCEAVKVQTSFHFCYHFLVQFYDFQKRLE